MVCNHHHRQLLCLLMQHHQKQAVEAKQGTFVKTAARTKLQQVTTKTPAVNRSYHLQEAGARYHHQETMTKNILSHHHWNLMTKNPLREAKEGQAFCRLQKSYCNISPRKEAEPTREEEGMGE